ncbi:MAG: ABC transporter substrate-binding protein, partial [Allosphingosinicella sp.]
MRMRFFLAAALAALPLAACKEPETGPVAVSAIGGPPRLVNPNRVALDPPAGFLLDAVAQGLVRFDASGEIEPALAQRWTVSDDGLRYTFRLARAGWSGGERVTAEQVAARLRAVTSPSSRNPVKPLFGAVDEIVAMTDEVLEISLVSPRPNFLQLLAQPELAILHEGEGSGPYRAVRQADGSMLIAPPREEDEEEDGAEAEADLSDPPMLLRGESAGRAVARFALGQADLVLGGRLGDLPLARAAGVPDSALAFDPVSGLFGLAFARAEGVFAEREARHALAMAIDRAGLVSTLRIPGLQPRDTLLPAAIPELPQPTAAPWGAAPLADRRAAAARTLAALAEGRPLTVRVALPEGLGYRLLFAHLKRDWAAIGVRAERVGPDAEADLALVDAAAPVNFASWYLRRFTCEESPVCDPAADEMIAAARIAPTARTRRALLANADRLLTDAAPFIPLAAPIRWSMVSPRLTAFRPNPFGRHPA